MVVTTHGSIKLLLRTWNRWEFRDLSGVPVALIPPQMMADDADPHVKEQYAMFQRIVRNINSNQQAGMVLPLMYDEVSKQPVFKFELLKNEGGKAYDTTKD